MRKLNKDGITDLHKKYNSLKSSHQIAIAITVFSFLWIFSGVVFPSAKEAEAIYHAKALKVRVSRLVSQSTKSEITILGRTQAFRKVVLKSEITGTVKNTELIEGSKVNEGDVLLEISKDDKLARLDEAKATVAQKNLEYNATKKLLKQGFNSKVKFSKARAALESAKANLKTAQLNFNRTSIKAPFSGIFDKRMVEKGDFVSNGTPIATIVSLNPIKFKAEVPEKVINLIRLGSKAQAKLITGEVIEGTISYISAIANENSRTFAVHIEAPNPDYKIVEGLTAETVIPLISRDAVKISPAILTLNDKGIVGVKTVDNKDFVEFHPVSIVKHNDDGMWVSGIPQNARVITAGQEFVKAKTKVIPISETKAGE